MKALSVTTMFLALAASAPAFAQEADAPPHPQDCLARPGENPGSAPEARTNRTEQESSDSDTLTSKLDPCNGVLRPPPVGDQMATPAPDEGKTPIIRPDEIEPQSAVPK